MNMTQMYYQKVVTAKWYDERLKKVVDLHAVTYEMSQKPDRSEILEKMLLQSYPSAEDLGWYDEEIMEFFEDMPIYPIIEIAQKHVQDISDIS